MKPIKKVLDHYHWLIVVGCFSLTFSGLGIAFNCVSMFIKPVIETLGFSRGEFTVSIMLVSASTMIASPVAGKLLDKYSMRLVMTLCSIIAALSFMLYSACHTLLQFYTCSVFLGLALAGVHIVPVSILITNWFKEKRGFFLAIAMTGGGIAGMVLSPLINWLITSYGWRLSFVVLGCLFAVFSIPTAFFIVQRHPSEMGLPAYGESLEEVTVDSVDEIAGLTLSQAVKTSAFWLLGFVVFVTGLIGLGIQMHIPAYITDLGHSSNFAANIVTICMGAIVLGKLIAGIIFDKFGMEKGVTFMYLMLSISALTLYEARTMLIFILFSVIFGLAFPIAVVGPPFLTAGIFGQKDYGVIYGAINTFFQLGAALGTPLSGYIYDIQGSYLMAWGLYSGLALACIPVVLLAIAKGKAAIEYTGHWQATLHRGA